jgi:hypothetical protein
MLRRWRCLYHLLCFGAALGFIVCCTYLPDPLPRPFKKTDANYEILTTLVKPSIALMVLPPQGPPEGIAKGFATAVAEQAQLRDIPATAASLEGSVYRLAGQADAATTGPDVIVSVEWTLISPAGENVHRIRTQTYLPGATVTDGTLWSAIHPTAMENLGSAAAQDLKIWFDGQKIAVDDARIDKTASRIITLAAVEGAPGDGNGALAGALMHALRERGQQVQKKDADPGYLINGQVTLSPAGTDREKVRIAWHILAPNGDFLGTVAQENHVPAGSLAKRWGETAYYAALAAVDGILELIDDYELSLPAGPAAG